MDKSITSQEYRTFLRQLRLARKRSGLNQIELAARIGETQSFVSKCERGERRLDVMELRVFCRAFGISMSAFIEALEDGLVGSAGQPDPRRRLK